jgi:nitrite reductase (NO-forming)
VSFVNNYWRIIVIKLKKLGLSMAIAASLVAFSAPSFSAEEMEVGKVAVEAQIQGLKRVTQTLVAPPFLPEHSQVAVGGPKIVEMTMTVVEKEMEIASGVFVQALTFEGSNPGPMIVAHVGVNST